MKQHGYIYRVTNLLNGTTYVGQRRGEFQTWYLGSGWLVRKAVLKHGASNFLLEFVRSAFDQLSLDRLEKFFIAEARKAGRTYNIRDGGLGSLFNGRGPMYGKKFSEVSKQRLSECRRGEKNPNFGKDFSGANNPMFGKTQSEEAKRKISAKALGKSKNRGIKRTPEQVAAMRQRAIEQKPWENHIGRKRSEETRRKISEAAKSRFARGFQCAFTPETRLKISLGRKRYWADKKAGLLK